MIHPSWDKFFESQSDLIQNISTNLRDQQTNPGPDLWFRAFQIDVEAVRVLILGQDPYPNPKHAHGLAFSVPPGTTPLPKSLQNIFKELSSDLNTPLRTNGNLEDWEAQGVWLLNRVLTTSPGSSMSHKNTHWQEFTAAAISFLNQHSRDRIAILWGRSAQQIEPLLQGWAVLKSPHPSPLSANRGFYGSKPFSRVNQFLLGTNQPLIEWG